MAAKMDRTRLADAIMEVGTMRTSGVRKGDSVNAPQEKVVEATTAPVDAPSAKEAPAPVDAGQAPAVHPAVDAADAKTDRIAFLCSPKTKKHLKRLAIDMDTDVSKLIYDALEAKGFLPK